MNIENLKQQWQESFEKSVKSVESYLIPENPDYPDAVNFRVLAKWLLENEYNGYDYMPNGYQDFRSTPFATESVLATLHHALCDDGEISFVRMIVEGEIKRVFMVFVWHDEDCFNTICQSENQSLIDSVINGRKSMQRVMTSMKDKYPGKPFKAKDVLSEKDFVFEAHRDPLQFIKDVEEFQEHQQKIKEKNNEVINKMKLKKP